GLPKPARARPARPLRATMRAQPPARQRRRFPRHTIGFSRRGLPPTPGPYLLPIPISRVVARALVRSCVCRRLALQAPFESQTPANAVPLHKTQRRTIPGTPTAAPNRRRALPIRSSDVAIERFDRSGLAWAGHRRLVDPDFPVESVPLRRR